MTAQVKPIFLRAEWRKLILANYAVDPELLRPYLPARTELDLWNYTCYVSLVGFMFLNTKVKGMKLPGHINFEEVNLRFYVKHKDESGEWKRGVSFIREIVPKPLITFVANTLYKEPYVTMPMRHAWSERETLNVKYSFKTRGEWQSFGVVCDPRPIAFAPGGEEDFITEHYWGYTKLGPNKTAEYGVEHPSWEVYPVSQWHCTVDFGAVYGQQWGFLNAQEPVSVFLAEGSEILVRGGRKV